MEVHDAANVGPDVTSISDLHLQSPSTGISKLAPPAAPLLNCYFTFSARNQRTGRAAEINKIVPQTAFEKSIFEKRAGHAINRKSVATTQSFSGIVMFFLLCFIKIGLL